METPKETAAPRTKSAYFTVDDCPSVDMIAKVDAVVKRNIPSIWFTRGEYVDKNGFDGLVYAIKKGCIIGNHSYTHPLFSRISLEQCREEIARTELLIEEAYRKAETPRPVKLFRFPFGDRGGGRNYQKTYRKDEQAKVDSIQALLQEFGFKRCIFEGVTYNYWSKYHLGDLIDAGVSLDVGEYQTIWEQSRARSGLHTLEDVLNHLNKNEPEAGLGLHSSSVDIVLLHDFPETTPMWEPLVAALAAQVTEWRMPKFA